VKQQETGSILLAQLPQRQLQFFRQIEFSHSDLWGRGLDLDSYGSGPCIPARKVSSAAVDRDRQDPRSQGTDTIPVAQMSHRPDQCLLSHVFGILTVSELPQAQRKHPPLKLLDESAQPILVPSQAAFDEFPVVHRAVHLSLEGDTHNGR
jgi:hypothetical protein